MHFADLEIHTAKEGLKWRTPYEKLHGHTPDITLLTKFHFWEPVIYMDPTHKFPGESGGSEKVGRWMGRAIAYGDGMASWILTEDTEELIVRHAIRPIDTPTPNEAHLASIHRMLEMDHSRKLEGKSPVFIHETGEEVEFPDGTRLFKSSPAEVDKDNLMDLFVWERFPSKDGTKDKEVKGQVKHIFETEDGPTKARVEFKNGKQELYEYEELHRMIQERDNKDLVDSEEYWDYDDILDHRWSKDPNRKGRIDVKVAWVGFPLEEATWEPMEVIKQDSPITLAEYADRNKLTHLSAWRWAKKYLKNPKKFKRLRTQEHLMKKRTGRAIRYEFGVQVPRSKAEACKLDEANGNTLWSVKHNHPLLSACRTGGDH